MNVVFRGIAAVVVGHVVGSLTAMSLGCTTTIIVDATTHDNKKARNSGAVAAMFSYSVVGIKTAAAVWRSTGE